MKRTGNLIEMVADLDNIRYAFYLASKGRHKKREVLQWLLRDTEKEFVRMQNDFLTANIKVGDYHFFKVYEPKERLIYASAFEERVIHHALMRVCSPIFEQFQISDSYACRVGKGQHKALEQARKNSQNTKWFVKMDICKYFDSIDHEILKSLLRRRIKDVFVLNAFDKIIDSYHSVLRGAGKGLPIGNLTSQYFANFYLGFADHFIKEKLRVKCYVRYMDDMVIWGNDKTELLGFYQKIKAFLAENLQMELHPICHNKTVEGVPFLGYRIMKTHLRLSIKSKKRYLKKLLEYRKFYNYGIWTESEYYSHATPLAAFVLKADTLKLRAAIQKK
ncbi:MAG: RNA-directed DNA polymerase [Bacteroidales bacterium]|jgi:retron-type reverse transcriptase|nr:RNA-directed DNA polymerase [Bacteroidales bacterium]